MHKYRTKGNVDLIIPGKGITVQGIITSNEPIENPNLILITDEQPAQGFVNGVVPQNAQTSATVIAPESEKI